ncbi:hypothetical protein [Chryseobacterium daeguense]|uniref:hypothetical protein n=1 Tax=Chryseobacterium daeguense TaxID=412438 RepID=UPI00041CFFEC|nr:hypothetical protein [Chryseobacterium daeguense]
MLSGGDVDRNGKVIITELEKGTYGNTLGKQNCGYQDVDVYFACYTGDHHSGNESTWGGCNWQSAEGGYPPLHYTIVAWVCTGDPDPIDDSTAPGGGGSTGGGGIIPNPDPQPEDPPCVVVPSTSLQTTLTDENGCAIGTPTLPNLGGNPKYTPCEKTKNLLKKPGIKTKTDTLYAQSKKTGKKSGEKAFMVKPDGTDGPIIIGEEHKAYLGDLTGYQGYFHNHTPGGVKMLSPPDIYKLFQLIMVQPPGTPIDSSFGAMVAAQEKCWTCPDNYLYFTYMIRFNGTLDEAKAINDKNYTEDQIMGLVKDVQKYEQSIRDLAENASQEGNFMSYKALEKVFFYALDKMNIPKDKVILQRIDKDGNVTSITTGADGKPTETPCP